MRIMCTITGKFEDDKTFTGYKLVVVDEHGHYYSPYTGIRYEVGKIKVPKIKRTACGDIIYNRYATVSCMNVLSSDSVFYTEQMIGKTGVLVSGADLCNMFDYDKRCAVIQMTIKGDLHTGSFANRRIVAGNEIVSMKKLKTETEDFLRFASGPNKLNEIVSIEKV